MKNFICVVFLSVVITSCVPITKPQATVEKTSILASSQVMLPTDTRIPTTLPPSLTPEQSATLELTATATEVPIPTLEAFPGVPDPRVSNPELFATEVIYKVEAGKRKEYLSPVVQFVNAMQMAGIEVTREQVTAGITYQELKDKDGNVVTTQPN